MANNPVSVPSDEEDKIYRYMMAWVNSYSDLPVGIVNYEQLEVDAVSMNLSIIAGSMRKYITGGHKAEISFSLGYRVKPATSNDKRLKADETLNKIGAWASNNLPTLGENMVAQNVEVTNKSNLLIPYEDGSEDHQILMKLTYEVI